MATPLQIAVFERERWHCVGRGCLWKKKDLTNWLLGFQSRRDRCPNCNAPLVKIEGPIGENSRWKEFGENPRID